MIQKQNRQSKEENWNFHTRLTILSECFKEEKKRAPLQKSTVGTYKET